MKYPDQPCWFGAPPFCLAYCLAPQLPWTPEPCNLTVAVLCVVPWIMVLQKQSLNSAVVFLVVVVLLTYVNKIHRPASYLEIFEAVEDSCLYKRKGPPQNLYLGDTGRILEEAGMLVAQGEYNIWQQLCSTEWLCL